jgi:hypothetical protein
VKRTAKQVAAQIQRVDECAAHLLANAETLQPGASANAKAQVLAWARAYARAIARLAR